MLNSIKETGGNEPEEVKVLQRLLGVRGLEMFDVQHDQSGNVQPPVTENFYGHSCLTNNVTEISGIRSSPLWRYSSYSPPENRPPLQLRKYRYGVRGVWRERRKPDELGVITSHHCSITLIVTVKLLGPNKVVRHLVQAN